MQVLSSALKNATAKTLEQAVANNHKQLFCMNAIVQDGDVQVNDGLLWTNCGTGHEAMVAFPNLEEGSAGAQLDKMIDYYRRHIPVSIGCWSLAEATPPELGVKLLARGFQPGWQPHWMALDLDNINNNHSVPALLVITPDNETDIDSVKNLPYTGDDGAVSRALLKKNPERARRFVATIDGNVVAHSAVFFTDGGNATAGIYNVGVVPRFRNRGIGKAVVAAACLYARQQGYHYAVLNGTGRKIYEQIGFQWVGDGLTWWLHRETLLKTPPSTREVMIAEAVGTGNLNALDEKNILSGELGNPLLNGMTLMQLAIYCKQPMVAEWLANHGASYTVIDAWDIGWKEKAAALLIAKPEIVNDPYEERQLTLLHIAVDRNDIDLARLVLLAKPDLQLKDKIYDGTALGWAEHLHRKVIADMIRACSL